MSKILSNLCVEAPELEEDVVREAYQEFPSEVIQLRNALMQSHIALIGCSYYAEGEVKKIANQQIERNNQLLGL